MPLDAGRLDKRVTIQTSARVDDDAGGQAITWNNVATVWASVKPGTGREFVAAQQITPELSHIVTMRYRDDVRPKQRLVYVSRGVARVFSIQASPDPDEQHEQLILYCSELVQS